MWVLTFGVYKNGSWEKITINTHTADREEAFNIAVEHGHDPYKLLQWKWVEDPK